MNKFAMPAMPWEAYFVFALIPVFFAGLLVVIAKVGGWTKLAEKFPADREPDEATCFRGQFLQIGWCGYNGCTTIRVSPDGLYLAVWPIFVAHPPILIPWSELRVFQERRRRWFAAAVVEVGIPTIAKLELPLSVVDAAREWLRTDHSAIEMDGQ